MLSFARTFAVLAVAIAAPLAAQENKPENKPETKTTAAPTAHIAIDTVGPDGWRMRLGPTNLGNLLASEKGRALWQPGVLPLLTQWQQLVGDEKEFAAVRERVLGYGGRIRVALQMPEKDSHIPFTAIVLDGDGRTDMSKLAADLRKLQDRAAGEWKKQAVDGRDVELRVHDSEAVTAPITTADRIVVAFGPAERIANALALAESPALAPAKTPLAPTSPALRIDVDVPALLERALQDEPREQDRAMMRAFGLPSLGRSSFVVGTAGPHVQLEVAQQFPDKPAGFFAALCPTNAGVPALQALLRDDSAAWKVGRFDWRALFAMVRDVVIASRESTAEELTKEIAKETGIELDADLLAHTTDDLLLELRIDEIERVEDANWVLSVGLRDSAAFGKGLATLLEHSKPVLTRAATTKVGDVDLHRYGIMFGYDVWLATANGRFLVAGGRDAEQSLTTFLQKTADKDQAMKTPASDVFRELQKNLPPGCNGLARGDVDHFVAPGALWTGLFELVDPFGSGDPVPAEQRELVRQLLRENNLAMLRSATGYADRTWRWRLYW